MSYNKQDALENIFTNKFNPKNPQKEIPFTRDEVREAIEATGGQVPLNLNNFVKDLVRTGNSHPRSETAADAGYFLREGSHTGSMGVFFKDEGPAAGAISVESPPDLKAKIISISLPGEVIDVIRPDEGGLLSVLDYSHLLDEFLEVPNGVIKRVQIPVKIQPHEIDGLFIMEQGDKRVLIPCEAKSQGNDAITLNQVVGHAAGALQRLMESDMDYVVPLGAKVEQNGDIFLVRFPNCFQGDLPNLREIISATSVVKQARYTPNPMPPKWVSSRPA